MEKMLLRITKVFFFSSLSLVSHKMLVRNKKNNTVIAVGDRLLSALLKTKCRFLEMANAKQILCKKKTEAHQSLIPATTFVG